MEFTGIPVGAGCTYDRLYDLEHPAVRAAPGSNMPLRKPIAGAYIVPMWTSFGYEALTHGRAGSGHGPHFDYDAAYPRNINKNCGSDNCTTSFGVNACGCTGGSQAPPAFDQDGQVNYATALARIPWNTEIQLASTVRMGLEAKKKAAMRALRH